MQNQAHITSFFLPQTIEEPKRVKSKRVLQTLTRMRHAEKESQEEKHKVKVVEDKITIKDETEGGVKSRQSNLVKKNSADVKRDKNCNEGKLATPEYISNITVITNRKDAIPKKRGQSIRGGKGKGKGQGKGKATGSIPVVPVEVVESTGRGRRGPREVVLSESSSSESDDEKPKRKQSGGFL